MVSFLFKVLDLIVVCRFQWVVAEFLIQFGELFNGWCLHEMGSEFSIFLLPTCFGLPFLNESSPLRVYLGILVL